MLDRIERVKGRKLNPPAAEGKFVKWVESLSGLANRKFCNFAVVW